MTLDVADCRQAQREKCESAAGRRHYSCDGSQAVPAQPSVKKGWVEGKRSESEGKMGSGLFEQAAGSSCSVWAAVRLIDTHSVRTAQ